MNKKVSKKLDVVYALINEADELRGYFKTKQEALDEANAEELEGATILKVTESFTLSYPEEPDIECFNQELFNLL